MGVNISEKDLKSWMLKNFWFFISKSKHEKWMFILENYNIRKPLTINFNVNKGIGIKDYTFKQVANIMKISKNELIKSIREKKKFSEEELINFRKIQKENSFISIQNEY